MSLTLRNVLKNERGAALILVLLVLFALSGLALLHLSAARMRNAVAQQRVEDDAAFVLAEAGAQDATLLIRNLDDKLDTNNDRQIDSKDAPYYAWDIPIQGGSYDYKVQGRFANEHTFYFRVTGGSWTRLAATVLEDGVEAASVLVDSSAGGPDYVQLTTSIDTDLHTYDLQIKIERDKAGSLNTWMKIDSPFVGAGTAGATKMFQFDAAADGDQTQTGTQNITKMLVAVEATTASGFADDSYTIESSGRVGNQRRNLQMVIQRNSLLKYARFSNLKLQYEPGAVLKGLVYSGGDLILDGNTVTFMKPVQVVGKLVNRKYGYFASRVEEGAKPILLPTAKDLEEFRQLAKKAGVYSTSSLTIDLSKFDFTKSPPEYDGNKLSAKFNGVVFSEGDVSVKGKLQGSSLSLFANNNIVITNSIYTGLNNPVDQRPVNVGLIAGNEIDISKNVPRICHINAALLALGTAWYVQGKYEDGQTDHPAVIGTDFDGDGKIGGYDQNGHLSPGDAYNKSKQKELGVYDVDNDGFIQSPDSMGWDENNVDGSVWALVIRGPIITVDVGASGTFADMIVQLHIPPPKQTRSYQYDPDITRYPPPHFPLPLNATQTLSFVESTRDQALIPPSAP